MWVWMGLCVSKISIVISQQCLLWSNGTFTFVLPHYIEYHASNSLQKMTIYQFNTVYRHGLGAASGSRLCPF